MQGTLGSLTVLELGAQKREAELEQRVELEQRAELERKAQGPEFVHQESGRRRCPSASAREREGCSRILAISASPSLAEGRGESRKPEEKGEFRQREHRETRQ